VFVSNRFIIGAEYRTRPDILRSFDEENGVDPFAAWLPHKQLALTGAYVDLGRIANRADQDAVYFSLQLSF
jgi:hypothetical protein